MTIRWQFYFVVDSDRHFQNQEGLTVQCTYAPWLAVVGMYVATQRESASRRDTKLSQKEFLRLHHVGGGIFVKG